MAEVQPDWLRPIGGRLVLPNRLDRLYAMGHLIRTVESTLLDLHAAGALAGTTHTCLGQELCQMAVVRTLDGGRDRVLSNHRNHGHFLTFSGDVAALMAEVAGRHGGASGGWGGSQHMVAGNFVSGGVQAGLSAIGVGLALAERRAGSGGLVVVILGDGSLGEGLLYESMNLAALWSAPVLFVVEHNGIAQSTRSDAALAGTVAGRAAAFGLRHWAIDDADPDLFDQAEAVVAAMRGGHSPGLLEIRTRRLGPHSKGDDHRPAAEMERIRERDPLTALGHRLDPAQRDDMERRNRAYVAALAAEVLARPPASPGVAAPVAVRRDAVSPPPPAAGTSYRAALTAALAALLADDPSVLLIGEDLADPYGGAFKVTAGLSTRFPDRVLCTPISEAGVVGAAIGLALAGARPVVEIMFADFLTLALDQIYNHAVKLPLLHGGQPLPLVIRTPSGGGRGYGPTHSQSPENLAAAIPGLVVVAPSHRHDPAALLAAAVALGRPVLFFEHKLLYGRAVDGGGYAVLPGAMGLDAAFPTLVAMAEAPDLTIVTFGGTLPLVEEAAAILRRDEELAVEILVPSLLAPESFRTIARRVRHCANLLVVEEGPTAFGIGAELAAILAESGFRGRVRRLGAPPQPIPAARAMEAAVLPSVAAIVDSGVRLFLSHVLAAPGEDASRPPSGF